MAFEKLWSLVGQGGTGDDLSPNSEKQYMPVNKLTVGMYIVELDRPWLETPFLFQGFEIKGEAQIQAVKKYCSHVYIDATKTKNYKYACSIPNNHSVRNNGVKILSQSYGEPPKKQGTFEKEVVKAEKAYKNSETLISTFMKDAARGGGIDGWLAKKAVADCVDSVLKSPDAMLWMMYLKRKDEYTVQHSLNVCVLAIVLGRHLNLKHDMLVTLGICGMLHDVGNMLIPADILNKEDGLTEMDERVLESHPLLGYELLKSSDHIQSSVLEVALTHHEHIDGSGFPRQLQESTIPDLTKIISVVDTYDGLTRNRFERKNKNHLEATQIMANMAGASLDRNLVVKFVESLGVYPPGCMVIMTNGCIGIVVEVNENSKLRPKVMILFDENRQAVAGDVIDLSQMVMDSKGVVYTIKNVVGEGGKNAELVDYYRNEALKKFVAR